MTHDHIIRMAREIDEFDKPDGSVTLTGTPMKKHIIEHIADCLVNDHMALIKENKQLRDELEILTRVVEERTLDYELLTEHYRELLADLAAIRARGDA